jgi:hypothetical protein
MLIFTAFYYFFTGVKYSKIKKTVKEKINRSINKKAPSGALILIVRQTIAPALDNYLVVIHRTLQAYFGSGNNCFQLIFF